MDLKQKLKNIGEVPGVYLMKDSQGNVIYIGKSKNIKKRICSYFQKLKHHSSKIEKLVKNIKDFDYIVTDTEFEAFMLECKLIRELKPMYNKLMKNPKAYVYIMIDINKSYPTIKITPDIDINNNIYFGPYKNKNTVSKALEGIKKCYKIPCTNIVRKSSPCLNHSLDLCVGMCVNDSALNYYNNIVKKIISFFEGNNSSIIEDIKYKMKKASETLDFEKAILYRDYLKSVYSLMNQKKIIDFTNRSNNIMIFEPLDEGNAIKLFFLRRNKILFSKKYELNNIDMEKFHKSIMKRIKIHFENTNSDIQNIMRKEEIDEFQIIYSYLNSKPNNYILIPEKWLEMNSSFYIYKAIDKVLHFSKGIFN